MDAIEHRIRECAYLLWEAEGRHEGRELEYWERARALVRTEQRDPPPNKTGSRVGNTANGDKNGETGAAKPKRTRKAVSKHGRRSTPRVQAVSAATSE